MATTKKKPAAKKSVAKKPAAKKSPVTKAKAAVSKALPAKKPSKVSTKATAIPKGREHKLAEQALSFVDQAAAVLRSGIREGAKTTASSRIAAKKKANELLGKASSNLSKAIGDGASTLQNLLGKI
jgi:hypothetical protein